MLAVLAVAGSATAGGAAFVFGALAVAFEGYVFYRSGSQ